MNKEGSACNLMALAPKTVSNKDPDPKRSFKDTLGEHAFGISLKEAPKIKQRKAIAESVSKIKDTLCNKHFLVPEDYQKVQWKALTSGKFFSSPAYWMSLSLFNLGSGINNLVHYGNTVMSYLSFTIFTICSAYAVASMCFKSEELVKELRGKGESNN